MLVHGSTDELVPFEESVTTLNQLRNAGVDVQLVTVPGVDHWLQFPGKRESPVETEQAHEKVVNFIRACLKSPLMYSYAREVCGRAVSGPQINPLFF